MADPRASARAQLRETRAVYMRAVLRYTYQQIADALFPCPDHESVGGLAGCDLCEPMYSNRGTAMRAVDRALARDYDAGEAARTTLRSTQLATIEQLLRKAVQDALGKGAPQDRARAMLASVRLLERQAKLAGLDAPTRVTVTDELDEQIRQALEDLASTPAPSPAQLREG